MLSKGAALYVRLITGMPFTDPTGGFKCFRRRALQSIDLNAIQSNGYSFQIEMTHKIWRQGMKVVEVPIIFTDRFQGRSKMSGGIMSAKRSGWSGNSFSKTAFAAGRETRNLLVKKTTSRLVNKRARHDQWSGRFPPSSPDVSLPICTQFLSSSVGGDKYGSLRVNSAKNRSWFDPGTILECSIVCENLLNSCLASFVDLIERSFRIIFCP